MSVLTFAVLLCGFVLPLGGELALLSHFFVPRSGRSSDASAVLRDDVGRAVFFLPSDVDIGSTRAFIHLQLLSLCK